MRVGNGTRSLWVALIGSLLVLGLATALLWALPTSVGVSWPSIGATIAAVPAQVLLGLVALWFAGLLVHLPVLMTAMPGLTARQALTLNLSGSAVSNLLPVGGPAGMGLGYAMARSWGFGSDQFASYTVSTNLWNAVGKFGVSLGTLATVGVVGVGLPSGLGAIVWWATAFVTLVAAGAALLFGSAGSTRAVGRFVEGALARLLPRSEFACSAWLLASRAELVVAIRTGWRRMSLGVLAYLGLQAALLWACLAATGAGASIPVVAVAFSVERLISLAPITPGASGVAELGTVTALHAVGIDAVSAAAGVLLYRILMFAIEIPVGGALALGWLRRERFRGLASGEIEPVETRELEMAG